jgi:hypothetical protein
MGPLAFAMSSCSSIFDMCIFSCHLKFSSLRFTMVTSGGDGGGVCGLNCVWVIRWACRSFRVSSKSSSG